MKLSYPLYKNRALTLTLTWSARFERLVPTPWTCHSNIYYWLLTHMIVCTHVCVCQALNEYIGLMYRSKYRCWNDFTQNKWKVCCTGHAIRMAQLPWFVLSPTPSAVVSTDRKSDAICHCAAVEGVKRRRTVSYRLLAGGRERTSTCQRRSATHPCRIIIINQNVSHRSNTRSWAVTDNRGTVYCRMKANTHTRQRSRDR